MVSCTTTLYSGGGESPILSNPLMPAPPLRTLGPELILSEALLPFCALKCCACKSVRFIVDVPLIGAVGDTDDVAGNNGIVSDLSSKERLWKSIC